MKSFPKKYYNFRYLDQQCETLGRHLLGPGQAESTSRKSLPNLFNRGKIIFGEISSPLRYKSKTRLPSTDKRRCQATS